MFGNLKYFWNTKTSIKKYKQNKEIELRTKQKEKIVPIKTHFICGESKSSK